MRRFPKRSRHTWPLEAIISSKPALAEVSILKSLRPEFPLTMSRDVHIL
jgi:hypothetical protein